MFASCAPLESRTSAKFAHQTRRNQRNHDEYRTVWNMNTAVSGGFNHLENYESQWEGLSHIYYGKIKNV